MIDPTAQIADGAVIGRHVAIGPNCVVGPNVVLGDGCQLLGHVHITGHTIIGARTVIHPFASVGSPPQSLKYRGGSTRLVVGSDCTIREGVTLNTGTEDDRGVTEVGDRCLLMAGAHVAHDCKLGNNVILANNVALGGHVTIGDFVVLGGQAAVRQFVRIGEGAMAAGLSGVRADVIPFGLVQGSLADLIGLNIIGMRRRGLGKADIHRLRNAYAELFFGNGTFRERLQSVAAQFGNHELGQQGRRLYPRWVAAVDHGSSPRRCEPGCMSSPLPANETVGPTPLAIICGSGSLPFAVADAAIRHGRRVVMFALHGAADANRISAYPHYWLHIGQFGRFFRLADKEGCRDVVMIGPIIRPSIWALSLDFGTLRLLPRFARINRGGDGSVLWGCAEILEERGLRLVGPQEVAPELLMPEGALGAQQPDERARSCIRRGLGLLDAIGPFDVGQAVVVVDDHVLAIEAAEGTDSMLMRVAELRRNGRIRRPAGGVLVKAPKSGQDQRVDLPTIGPQTIEGAARAALDGIALVAGSSIVAEPERISQVADRERLFVIGIRHETIQQ